MDFCYSRLSEEMLAQAMEMENKGDYVKAVGAFYAAAIIAKQVIDFEDGDDDLKAFARQVTEQAIDGFRTAEKAIKSGGSSSASASASAAAGGAAGATAAGAMGGGGDADGGCPTTFSAAAVDSNASFSSIVGAIAEKINIQRSFVYPSTYPRLFEDVRAVLLYGPPGNGKTLLARGTAYAISQMMALPVQRKQSKLIAATGAELKGKFVGQTEKCIRKLYDTAAESAVESNAAEAGVSVVFLDEIDAIAGLRGDDPNMTSSVNALLAVMDGVDSKERYKNVKTLAATNLPWNLDGGVQRRFPIRIFVDLPSDIARAQIISNRLQRYFLPETRPQDLPQLTWDGEPLNAKLAWADGVDEKDTWAGYLRKNNPFDENDAKNKPFDLGDLAIVTVYTGVRESLLPTSGIADWGVDAKIALEYFKSAGRYPTARSVAAGLFGGGSGVYDERFVGKNAAFGYSGSDVDNLAKLAINDSAFEFATTRELCVVNKDTVKRSKDVKTCKTSVCILLGENQCGNISTEARKKLSNDFISMRHFVTAFNGSNSSINPRDYAQLLCYKFNNEKSCQPRRVKQEKSDE